MNQASPPKVTVLMSVYNGEDFLKESIESIINQTFADFEFIIINDCSTDDSLSIIDYYGKKDKRIVICNNEINLGLAASLNRGISAAKGEYIARMDADDISLPQRLEKQVEFMNNNPDIGICGGGIEFFDESGYTRKQFFPAGHKEIVAMQFIYSGFAHPAVIFRKELILKYNLFYNEDIRYAQDYELWYRMLKHTQGANLQECLLKFRFSPSQVSNKYENLQNRSANKVRLLMLSELGIEAKELQENFHNKILSESLTFATGELIKFKNWFECISETNRKKNIFTEPCFSGLLAKYYYEKTHCIKRFKSFRIYKNSKLFEFYPKGEYFSIAVFKIKSLIKLLAGRK